MTRAKLAIDKFKFIRAAMLHCFVASLLVGAVKAQIEEIVRYNDSGSETQSRCVVTERTSLDVFEEGDAVLPTVEHRQLYRRKVPRYFDARKYWNKCTSIINYRRDQGKCQSCWAESTASAIGDRICISTKGAKQMIVSSEDIVTCCRNCRNRGNPRCGYGYARRAYLYWKNIGVVSGGVCLPMNRRRKYLANQGCKPYSVGTYQGNTPQCRQRCSNPKYHTSYKQDKVYGRLVYVLPKSNPKQMQLDILHHGSLVALMQVYTDLRNYTSGIYISNKRKKDYMHFVKIIGWGVERNKRYWLLANSYGRRWGENGGLFRTLRGNNYCGIENFVVAGRTKPMNIYREAMSSGYCLHTEFMSVVGYELLLLLLVLNAI